MIPYQTCSTYCTIQQRKRFYYPQMNTTFREFHGYIKRVEQFDHQPGRFSGGLRTVEESSAKLMKAQHSDINAKCVCMKRTGNTSFNLAAATAARRASRPCGHRHPGLCRIAHKETLADSLRLAKNIYDQVKGLKEVPGECIVEFAPAGRVEDAKLWWVIRALGKPRRIYLAAANITSHKGINYIVIVKPIVRETNYGIARVLMEKRVGGDNWTMRRVLHRTTRGHLTHAQDVGRGESLLLSCSKLPKPVVEVDPLEKALAEASGAPQIEKKRRRSSKKVVCLHLRYVYEYTLYVYFHMSTHYKVADPGSASNTDPDESMSSESQLAVEHSDKPTAKAFARKTFFLSINGDQRG